MTAMRQRLVRQKYFPQLISPAMKPTRLNHTCCQITLTMIICYRGGTDSTPDRTRTYNLLIRSQTLYPLSYRCILVYRLLLYQNFNESQRKSLLYNHLRRGGAPRHAISPYAIRVYAICFNPFGTGTTAVTSGL
jgi:hypothetical protein